jgi:DNA-binding CsgD family transcriptional regulator
MAAPIRVCVALVDEALAHRIGSLLTGDEGIAVLVEDEHAADVVLTDHVGSLSAPAILFADEPMSTVGLNGAIHAVLPTTLDAELLRAAIILVSAGFSISEPDHGSGSSDATEISLTARESEVLSFIAQGASNKAIARELDISLHTAKFHVASVLAKLGARNRADALAIAIRRGLVLI